MKKTTHIVIGLIVVFYSHSNTSAEPTIPNESSVRIDRNGFELRFTWHEDPGFELGQAAEFEVIIDSVPQKCFAQPIGGSDYDPYSRHVIHNLPDGYTDVWNFSFPRNPVDIYLSLSIHCGGIAEHELATIIITPQNWTVC